MAMCAGVQNESRPMVTCQEMSQMIPTVMHAAANTSTGTTPARIRACELFTDVAEVTGRATGADAERVDSMEKLMAPKPPPGEQFPATPEKLSKDGKGGAVRGKEHAKRGGATLRGAVPLWSAVAILPLSHGRGPRNNQRVTYPKS